MSILIFEDSTCDALAPVSYGRFCAAITCGSYRLIDLLQSLKLNLASICRPYLKDILQRDLPDVKMQPGKTDDNTRPTIMLSARCVPSQALLQTLNKIISDHSQSTVADNIPTILFDRQTVAAIINPPWTIDQILRGGYEDIGAKLTEARKFNVSDKSIETFELPHEIISQNMSIIGESLEARIKTGQYEQIQDGVFVKSPVKLGQYLIFDASKGPIVIEANVSVGAYTLLRGPIYIGANSKILEHSAIKDFVSLSHTTKMGGEVEAAVVEAYTNKQHHGFLGHSYLGSWINLGAGTCNSDLKNTYGLVNMEYPVGKSATGMQFLGCVMGDYSKTAINTGIFTGKVIGVCSMMYGFVTSNVPSFVNYARLFGQIAELPPDVMIATQQRTFARRLVTQRDCDIQLIHDLFALTQAEREQAGDVLNI